MTKTGKFLPAMAVLGLAGLMVQAQDSPYPPPPQQQPGAYPQQAPYPQQEPGAYSQQQPAPYPQQQQAPYPYPAQQGPYPQQQPYAYQQPPMMSPQQLDGLVQRIALYPDPLLAQILTASTYSQQIPDAAAWAQQHRYLQGDALSEAIQADNLPFDPSVIALLPFPQVLDMMARDPGWTQALGNAVLADRAGVMDAVQRERRQAMDYGYLQSNQYDRVVVNGPGDIEVLPVDPAYMYVPLYNPAVVFARPRAGFFVGGAITWGPRVYIGGGFRHYGWGVAPAFGWRSHDIVIDSRPWGRTWSNRGVYVHPYAHPYVRPVAPRVERHEVREFHEEHREHR